MQEVVLQRKIDDDTIIAATFLPEQGMTLASLKKGDIEVIDQDTKPRFEERRGGLGALIGPHFYHRNDDDIAFVPDETLFPFIETLKKEGKKEFFSHGIARYVPWNYTYTDVTIEGTLSGIDTANGITLAALEGFDFEMSFKAHITKKGLEIDYKVTSHDKPSIAGLHYYYRINEFAKVTMQCRPEFNDKVSWKPIDKKWLKGEDGQLLLTEKDDCDYAFLPDSEKENEGEVLYETKTHKLKIHYKTTNEENSFQLFHPQDAGYFCIEPVTAKNARQAKNKTNHLEVEIEII